MMGDKKTCGITEITKATGMRRIDILAHIESGKIKAEIHGRQYAFEVSEKTRLGSLHDTYAGFFRTVQEYVGTTSAFSLAMRKCREALLEFAMENSWFGAEAIPSGEVFFADTDKEAYFFRKSDEHRFERQIRLWVASYGASAEGKLRLLLGKIQDHYPETEDLLRRFFKDEYPDEYAAAWMLTDFLCSALRREITQSGDKTLDSLAKSADAELPLNSARMFSAFLEYLRNNRKLGNGWTYNFQSRGKAREISAYPVDAFLRCPTSYSMKKLGMQYGSKKKLCGRGIARTFGYL